MDVLLLLPHKITSLSLWKLHQTPKSTERLSAKLSSKQTLLQTAFSGAPKHLIEFPIHLHIPIHLFRCEKLICMCMNSCSFSLYQIIKPLFCFCSRHLCCFQVQTHFSVMKNGRFTSGNKRGLQSTNTSAALLALSLLSPVRLCCKHAPRLSASIFPAPCQPSIAASKDHPPEMLLISSYHYLAV